MKIAMDIVVKSVLISVLLLILSCLKNDDLEDEIGSWSFSGTVLDGESELPLSDVVISYPDEDGTIQSILSNTEGNFFINDVPYGERTFKFALSSDDTTYTHKTLVVSSETESVALGGVIGDVSQVVYLYPRTGSISGTLFYQPKGTDYKLPVSSSVVKIEYRDALMQNTEPGVLSTFTDSLGNFILGSLPVVPGGILTFSSYERGGVTYTAPSMLVQNIHTDRVMPIGAISYSTTDSSTTGNKSILKSNVLTSDGFGLTDISVNSEIWYKIPTLLKTASAFLEISGAEAIDVSTRLSNDTVYITPLSDLPYSSLVAVRIIGQDLSGSKWNIELDGIKQFKTEKSAYPVETNFWEKSWQVKGRFSNNDTLWVRFSEELDTLSSSLQWIATSAESKFYGSGSKKNGSVWISKDTLYLVPDQRLPITYNSTLGFHVSVKTLSGKISEFYDFVVNTIEDPLFMVWTNTKDALGRTRVDMGLRDTIKVVSSISNFSVVGVSIGDTGLAPPGLLLSDIEIKEDTIIYMPSFSMTPDTSYSLDFDLELPDGQLRQNVLGVSWETKKSVTIVDVDTRVNGMYRPMAAYGDSFTVTFSEAIDTSINAAVAFRVNIQDVWDIKKRSIVKWDSQCKMATIFPIDTLPTADFDAPAAYTATAVKTKAVESVTFDLVTKTGEQVLGCRPDGDPISLHTEKGMCLVMTNIIPSLDGRLSVEKGFTPTSEFPVDEAIDLQFNRLIDTTGMRMDSLILHVGIQKSGAVDVPTTATILPDLKTIRIIPNESLESKTKYYVVVKNIPAIGISSAAPIGKHGGLYSGTALNSYLLERPFTTL